MCGLAPNAGADAILGQFCPPKIAQPFKAGPSDRIGRVPAGTAESFFRPHRDWKEGRHTEPSHEWLGYFQMRQMGELTDLTPALSSEEREKLSPLFWKDGRGDGSENFQSDGKMIFYCPKLYWLLNKSVGLKY